MTPVKTTGIPLRTMTAVADVRDPPAPHDHGHAHNHDHSHGHDHAHHHAHAPVYGGHASASHLHANAARPAEATLEQRPAFRAGLSLVRMSMGARLAIALCAIVALWAIVLMAMM